MNNAVLLLDVGDGDVRHPTHLVGQRNLAFAFPGLENTAANCCDVMRTTAKPL
ncbi:hypothetical protein [Agrobacterium burrii]